MRQIGLSRDDDLHVAIEGIARRIHAQDRNRLGYGLVASLVDARKRPTVGPERHRLEAARTGPGLEASLARTAQANGLVAIGIATHLEQASIHVALGSSFPLLVDPGRHPDSDVAAVRQLQVAGQRITDHQSQRAEGDHGGDTRRNTEQHEQRALPLPS